MPLSSLFSSRCFQCLCPRRSSPSRPSNNPDLYVDLQHLHRKPRSGISRENLLLQLQKLIARVIIFIEVAIVMHMLLAFLSANPPSNFFWGYLGNSKDQSSAIFESLQVNANQTRLNVFMALLTLGALIWSYVTSCWTTEEGIRRFSWILLVINCVSAVILAFETSGLVLVFSKAVLVGLRGLILIFNMLTVAKCFKLAKVYALLKIEENAQQDIELPTLNRRLLP